MCPAGVAPAKGVTLRRRAYCSGRKGSNHNYQAEMNVLILGSGGREHAMAWKIAQSSLLTRLYISPGNAGTDKVGTNIDLPSGDFRAIGRWALEAGIDMLVVGPEQPLVEGIADYFSAEAALRHIKVIGPGASGAQLEGSKDFAKAFMQRHHIPTARYRTFDAASLEEGIRFIGTLAPPYVLKADGLAAGKGVLILNDAQEAATQLRSMLIEERFGDAGRKVVIEEFLSGIEVSMFVLTDGFSYKLLPEAKDYKRIGEGDTGPNTGGMGAVSPVPFVNDDFREKVVQRIVVPTLRGLHEEKIEYRGFIFIGLMKVGDEPYVIEYNCRMGDPETEAVIPRIKSDLLDLFEAVATGTLSERDLTTDGRTAATVVLVSEGYPGDYQKGKAVSGLEQARGEMVFHAGTRLSKDKVVTAGGRVFAVTGMGANLEEALAAAYANAAVIEFTGKTCRGDIGRDLLSLAGR